MIAPVLTVCAASAADVPTIPGEDVVLPKLIHDVPPEWPASVPHEGSHKVTMQAVIRADGTVGEVMVLASSDARFSEAAVHSVQRRRYEPATQAGKPIAIYFTVIVKFVAVSGEPRVRPPKLAEKVEPTYPADLLAQQVDGDVELELQVNSKGRVQAVRVVESSHESFSKAAIIAVQRWRYEPATESGKPVASQVNARVRFRWRDAEKRDRHR